jgi:hypothetical protein
MSQYFKKPHLFIGLALLGSTACIDEPENPKLRAEVEYSSLDSNSSYASQFLDANGTSTVALKEGNISLTMFQTLNKYVTTNVSANTGIDKTKLSNLFTNTQSPFLTLEIIGNSFTATDLNNSDISLSERVAASKSAQEIESTKANFESLFADIEETSLSVNEQAGVKKAGKLGNYLLDENGIELAQVIQKSFIGAFQLDYIGNILLSTGLSADNTKQVQGENYTQLEHNWDVAYGTLTTNPIYLEGFTDSEKGTVSEFGAGSYIWEYNKGSYAKIYPAFLKGRAAIVNNDLDEVENQALFIRKEFEKSLANAAIGYLGKWRTSATEDKRAHAIGEAIGFIYSLRFATTYQADSNFSDSILASLIGSENGFWDLDATKISNAEAAIKEKFNL